jgi:hypothetical protein
MNSANEIYRQQQDAYLMLMLMGQGEIDVLKGRVTSQPKVFDGLRASLLKQQRELTGGITVSHIARKGDVHF